MANRRSERLNEQLRREIARADGHTRDEGKHSRVPTGIRHGNARIGELSRQQPGTHRDRPVPAGPERSVLADPVLPRLLVDVVRGTPEACNGDSRTSDGLVFTQRFWNVLGQSCPVHGAPRRATRSLSD